MTFKARIEQLKESVCRIPVLGILVRAALESSNNHVKDMAASIAFFTVLSMFPLILGLSALAGSVLKSPDLQKVLTEWVNEFFPVGADFVTQNVESMVRLRGAAGLVSVLVLFWSAKKMVGAISRGINQTMGLKRDHAFYLSPLRDYGLVLAISLLMFATTAVSPIADLLSNLELSMFGETIGGIINLVGGSLISVAMTAAMLSVTYFLIPYSRMAWSDVLPGVVTAAIMIELGKKLFIFYVNNVSKLDALYGSISSMIVLMLWLYFFGRVLLYGAGVISVVRSDRHSSGPEAGGHQSG